MMTKSQRALPMLELNRSSLTANEIIRQRGDTNPLLTPSEKYMFSAQKQAIQAHFRRSIAFSGTPLDGSHNRGPARRMMNSRAAPASVTRVTGTARSASKTRKRCRNRERRCAMRS
ncbi:hypothetical protein [Burkholderia savannae]|uniref:hypothetical protein n=1 Tax=Burkholderia savannae TaxID=1637837 RepID=UPI0012E3EF57|nr:hypothetical protein [Burkholderia savannae]